MIEITRVIEISTPQILVVAGRMWHVQRPVVIYEEAMQPISPSKNHRHSKHNLSLRAFRVTAGPSSPSELLCPKYWISLLRRCSSRFPGGRSRGEHGLRREYAGIFSEGVRFRLRPARFKVRSRFQHLRVFMTVDAQMHAAHEFIARGCAEHDFRNLTWFMLGL